MKLVWLVGLVLPAVVFSTRNKSPGSSSALEQIVDAELFSWLRSVETPQDALTLVEECCESINRAKMGNTSKSPQTVAKMPLSPKSVKPSPLFHTSSPDSDSDFDFDEDDSEDEDAGSEFELESPPSSPQSPSFDRKQREKKKKVLAKLKAIQSLCFEHRHMSHRDIETMKSLVAAVKRYEGNRGLELNPTKSRREQVRKAQAEKLWQIQVSDFIDTTLFKEFVKNVEHNTLPEDMAQLDQQEALQKYCERHQGRCRKMFMKGIRRHYRLRLIERHQQVSYSKVFTQNCKKWRLLAHLYMATSIYAKFAVEGVTKGLKSLETPSPSNEKINTVPLARLWYPVIDDLLSTLVINDQVDAAKLLAEWIQAQLKSGLSPMSPTYLLKEVPLPPGVALPLNVHRTLDDLFKPAPLPPGIVLPPQQPESPPTLPQSPDPQPPWQLLPAAEVPSSRPAGGFSTGSGTTQSSSESSPRSPTSARYYGHDPWSEHHRLLELLFKRAVWAYKLGRQEMQKALLDQITCENLRNQVFRDECIALKNTGALPSVYQVSLETSQDAIAGSSSNSNDGSATQSASTTATDQDMVPQNPDMYDFPSNYQILFSGTRVTQISKPDAPVNLQKDEPPVSEDENNYTN